MTGIISDNVGRAGGVIKAPSSGAYSVIKSGTATSASDVEFTDMTHDIHVLDIWCLDLGSAAAIELRFSADNGSSYLTAQYDNYFTQMYAKTNGNQSAQTGGPGSGNVEISLVGAAAAYTSGNNDPMSNNGTGSMMATITFDRNKGGTHIPYGHAIVAWEPAGWAPAIGVVGFKANLSSGNDIDAMKLIPSSGTFDKVKYRLIGYSI